MESRARVFVSLKTKDMQGAKNVLEKHFEKVRGEEDCLRVYDVENAETVVETLLKNGHTVSEIKKNKVGLEEYYMELMSRKEAE